jgi:hypothetical protein
MLLNRYYTLSLTALTGAGSFAPTTAFYGFDGGIQTIAAGGQTSFAAEVASNMGSGAGKSINVACLTDQASAASGLILQLSIDQGTTWKTVASASVVANTLATLTLVNAFAGAQYRVQLTNGATPQGFLWLGASITEV